VGKEEYIIYRSEEKDGIYQKIGTAVNEIYSDVNILPNTTYYYVITQKVNNQESVYSEKISATTGNLWSCGEELVYGGKNYKTIKIGEQCWFQEDLNVEGSVNAKCNIEKKCYNNSEAMCKKYGAFYNYENISCGEDKEGIQGICPLGWRIPTDEDWKTLEMEAGMREEQRNLYGLRGVNEASKLSGEYELWQEGVLKNNNVFGVSNFNILPAGLQSFFKVNSFLKLGETNIFWSSTKANEGLLKVEDCNSWETAYFVREINYNSTQIKRYCLSKNSAAHLRCMRDY
jgi:uncharacterized protein (TIGR02145 family)